MICDICGRRGARVLKRPAASGLDARRFWSRVYPWSAVPTAAKATSPRRRSSRSSASGGSGESSASGSACR